MGKLGGGDGAGRSLREDLEGERGASAEGERDGRK